MRCKNTHYFNTDKENGEIICYDERICLTLHSEYSIINMERKDFRQLSDNEFKAAMLATLNLKKEWMASVKKREKELGLQ